MYNWFFFLILGLKPFQKNSNVEEYALTFSVLLKITLNGIYNIHETRVNSRTI